MQVLVAKFIKQILKLVQDLEMIFRRGTIKGGPEVVKEIVGN